MRTRWITIQISKSSLTELKSLSENIQRNPWIPAGTGISSIFNRYFNGEPGQVGKSMEIPETRAMLYRELSAVCLAASLQKKLERPKETPVPKIQVIWQDENLQERLGKLEMANGLIYLAATASRFARKWAGRGLDAVLGRNAQKGLENVEKFAYIAGNIAFEFEKEGLD